MSQPTYTHWMLTVFGISVFSACLFAQSDASSDSKANPWPGDYRHVHKPQLQAIVDGDFATAIEESDKILATHPKDAESLFFRSVAIANQPDTADKQTTADKAVNAAINAGIPNERFLCGSDPWTETFRRGDAFEWLRNSSETEILCGPMLGNVTPTSAQIWIRATPGTKIDILYKMTTESGQSPTPQRTSAVDVTDSTDGSAVLTLSSLQPSTEYTYWVAVDGSERKHLKGAFRTPPAAGSSTKFTVAFGGGAAYLPHKEHMWKTIEERNPDLLLLLGDNVYIDDPKNETYQRYLYYRRQCQPDYRSLGASTAVYSIWDDHDFGKNDCHGGPLVDTPSWKIPVWKVFQQNWVNPNYGGGEAAPGCWYEFHYGDVQFILLDGRYYRDPKPADGSVPTMLGTTQKAWLKQTLRQSSARIKVLCSPVPFSGGNPDKWTGFPEERDEIFSFIESNSITGVLLVSADRHRSDLLVHRRKSGKRYFEFMSSKLTNHHTHRLANEKDGAIFSYNDRCSFGLIEFDTTKDIPVVDYRVIDIDGEQHFYFTTKLQ